MSTISPTAMPRIFRLIDWLTTGQRSKSGGIFSDDARPGISMRNFGEGRQTYHAGR
jgi:hypothetical protein